MLDVETRRRIDAARDMLVGKVPDPKSQVEQITIALIYKFMDDMDTESEELGGKRKFFTGDFARYGWSRLMAPSLGGHEMLGLYGEGISKMPENPGIPALFREIFKNAYLPYRDPETLKAFLKVINEFEYDHSERLGDAFEYLLSVLGSQGDAGQFRTPRHIIDFIVEIISPRKGETVLDPACGTAGFLISAYKHILRANTDRNGEIALTPDDRGHLARNFKGYDISPDMVRLSLVNLYLHGFADPHIYEYDTLTSTDRWQENADVIFANPPFMSPTGGIKPHARFSVQSKRSEVLFVDYIAEHLTAQGRAGIVVPEGIVFQSQRSYVTLRKLLVENSLVAVISLPAGVFQPYAGVKTSVLILDRMLARRVSSIAFYKVENDGFSLGVQRRAIEENDLPGITADIRAYLDACRLGKAPPISKNRRALLVEKSQIAASGEFNLSMERYRIATVRNGVYPHVPLGSVCELLGGGTPSRQNHNYWNRGSVKWISSKHIGEDGVISGYERISKKAVEETATRIVPQGSTVIVTRVSVGKFAFADDDYAINQDLTALVSRDPSVLDPRYLQAVASRIAAIVERSAEGLGVRGITRQALALVPLPLPPLNIQSELAIEIEGYNSVLRGVRAVVENYMPGIPIQPEWPMVPMRELVESSQIGVVRSKGEQGPSRPYPYIKMNCIGNDGTLDLSKAVGVDASESELTRFTLQDGDFIYNTRNAPDLVGKSAVYRGESGRYIINNNILRIRFNERAVPEYVNAVMLSSYGREMVRAQVDATTSVAALYQKNYLAIEIPVPSVAVQQQLVAELQKERLLISATRQLGDVLIAKRRAALARVWGGEE